MSASSHQIDILVRRFAVLTCVVALLPISVGALVTTMKAGMAFVDWPTSDGQNMLLYPWLRDLRHTDKFVEHGHRLAGVLIGLVSIGLVFVALTKECPRWVKGFSLMILLAVISQGLLGGMRVRLNAQVLAMTHSITGGLFFTLCCIFAQLVRRPSLPSHVSDERVSVAAIGLTLLLPGVVLIQYVLGGFFRHLGVMLHEHVAGAIVVSLCAIMVAISGFRSMIPRLRLRSGLLGMALGFQILLGLGAWATRLGVPSLGWVANMNSPAQTIVCSLHTVGGMFLLASSGVLAVEMLICIREGRLLSLCEPGFAAGLSARSGGGAT